MKVKKLLFPPVGEPEQELVDFCKITGIEFIRLDETGLDALKARRDWSNMDLNLQTGENVPLRADKKMKISKKIELNPLESLFIFPRE